MCHGTFVRGRGQCMSWLSFSKVWIPGMNLRLSAVASTLFFLLSVLAALNLYSTSQRVQEKWLLVFKRKTSHASLWRLAVFKHPHN